MKESTKLLLVKLNSLLKGMDIPSFRREDPKWLLRNLGTRNLTHPNYEEAIGLIKQLVRMGL